MQFRLRLDHVSLIVRDLDVSAAFYRDDFGLSEIANGTGRPQFRWFGISDHHALHIGKGDPGEPSLKKGTHLALCADNFDEVLSHLDTNGIAYAAGRARRAKCMCAPTACAGSI